MKQMDLNCDMGELPEMLADGTQEDMMRQVTSVNIACGGHAGDARLMRETIEQALRASVAVGAHPGYEDRANFGRMELSLSPDEIAASVHKQLQALAAVAEACGAHIGHVKAHGALYNQAARDPEIAKAIATGVRRWRSDVVLVGLAGSRMLDEFSSAGFPVAAEAFADRRYDADGSLRPRKFRDALLSHPNEAATQALRIVEQGNVVASNGTMVAVRAETICIHGDTPGAAKIAAAVQQALGNAGIILRPMGSKI
jgi:5-oxoprolinase (ATP-hydrolysing) subunit A